MNVRTTARLPAALAGATFLLAGILGFVPGITTSYGDLGFAGRDSGAKLLGVLQVSVLHNLVHLAFGVVVLALARTEQGARAALTGGGTFYLAWWLVGVVGAGGFIPVNTADNWFHLLVGLGLLTLGFVA